VDRHLPVGGMAVSSLGFCVGVGGESLLGDLFFRQCEKV